MATVDDILGSPTVDDVLGPAPQEPVKPSPAFIDRLAAGIEAEGDPYKGLGRIGAAAAKGAAAGFGADAVGLHTGSEYDAQFREAGILPDYTTGRAGPIRLLSNAFLKPASTIGDGFLRALNGLKYAAAGAAGQTALELGQDETTAGRLTRDIGPIADTLGVVLGGGSPLSRIERAPTGELRDVKISAGLPTPADFDTAAKALTGPEVPAPAVSGKLLTTYNERGLLPAEVAHDARSDVTITQDLLADNRTVPEAYGGGKPPPPPEEPLPKPAAEPPPAGSAEEARQTILDKISVGEADPRAPMTWQRLYTQTVDDLNPIKQAIKGAPEDASPDAYTLARLTRGTFGKADQMLDRGTFDFHSYETNGPGLKSILAPVADDLDGARAYLAARRAIELDGRGIDAGLDLDAARKVVGDGEGKYGAIQRQLVDYQDRVTQYLRDAGVLSEKAYAAMREANKDYVPFFRVMEDGTTGGSGAGRGFSGKNPLQAIKGSDRTVVDPLESVIKNTYAYVSIAERNAVGIKLIDTLKAMDEGVGYERALLPVDAKAAAGSDVAEMRPFLERHDLPEEPDLVAFIKTASLPPEGDTISAFRDGVKETYKVADQDLLRSYRGLDVQTAGLLTRILAAPARTLRAGAVLTPDFMARNLIRDLQTAFVNSKGLFSPIDTTKGLVGLVRKDADFEAWMKGGGANSAMVALDRQYLQQRLLKLDSETGLMSRAWNVVKSPLEGLRMVSEFTENATRLGEFKKVLGGATDKASIQAAAFDSREVTLDFARIGAQMRGYNMITAFANANIQGVDRLARAFGDAPAATTAKIAGGVTVPSMLLWWANHEDPRYKEIPRWEKDLFWIFMTKDHIYRVPKPFETGVMFGSGVERTLDALMDHDPRAFDGFSSSLLAALLPSIVPTMAVPIVEHWANRSYFTGAPLIPDRLEKLLPEYQYNPYTTETAKALGRVIGAFPGVKGASLDQRSPLSGVAEALTSPALIENYVRAWTGGMGQYALAVADKSLRAAGALPDPTKPAATLADIPFVRAFVVRYPSASSAQSVQDFYERFTEKKRVYDTIMAKAKEGDLDAVKKEMAFDPSAMAQLAGLQQVIGMHSTLIRQVYQNPTMKADEKRQLIDTTYFHMIELAAAGNSALDQIEKAFSK
jgi:hypothetical protein